jgi:hypothetical protein
MINASSFIITVCASGSRTSVPEVLIPSPQQCGRVFLDQPLNASNLCAPKSATPFEPNWIQPELRYSVFMFDVHMGRLIPIRRIKEKSI